MITKPRSARTTNQISTAVVGCGHRNAARNSTMARMMRSRRLLFATHVLDDITPQPVLSAPPPAQVIVRPHQFRKATAGWDGPTTYAVTAITMATSRMLRTDVCNDRK